MVKNLPRHKRRERCDMQHIRIDKRKEMLYTKAEMKKKMAGIK